MDDITLRYYEYELRYLREAGKEFARIYPEHAALLNMEKNNACDPMVERLFEGFAFLVGRLRRKLDDEFPEFIKGVINLCAPQYLRMIPSLTIVELGLRPYTLQQDEIVPAGFSLLTSPLGHDGERYQYCTTSDVILHPLHLVQAAYTMDMDGSSRIRLGFQLESQAQREAVNLSRLRFFLNTDQSIALALHLALTRQIMSIDILIAGKRLNQTSTLYFEPFGFSPDHTLWPQSDTVLGSHLLLLDYFAFREKFFFIDLCGLDIDLLCLAGEGAFEVDVHLACHCLPNAMCITPTTFCLYCAPAINLFKLDAEPIRVDPHIAEYRIIPARHHSSHIEVFSVDDVRAFNHLTGDSQSYVPFYSFRHRKVGLCQDASAPHFHTRIQRTVSGLYETWLVLDDPNPSHCLSKQREETLSLRITATNRMLSQCILRESKITEVMHASPGVASVRNLTVLTLPHYPPSEDAYYWYVLAHFAANYLSLLDTDVLRNTLALYDWTHDELNQRRLAGILQINHQPLRCIEQGCIRRGVEISITLDRAHFAGDGDLALFGTLLHHFFARYADLNLFTKLVVIIMPTGQRLEWKASKRLNLAW